MANAAFYHRRGPPWSRFSLSLHPDRFFCSDRIDRSTRYGHGGRGRGTGGAISRRDSINRFPVIMVKAIVESWRRASARKKLRQQLSCPPPPGPAVLYRPSLSETKLVCFQRRSPFPPVYRNRWSINPPRAGDSFVKRVSVVRRWLLISIKAPRETEDPRGSLRVEVRVELDRYAELCCTEWREKFVKSFGYHRWIL